MFDWSEPLYSGIDGTNGDSDVELMWIDGEEEVRGETIKLKSVFKM